MIGIDTLVMTFLFLLGCGAIFALLWYLVTYLEKEFPAPLFWKIARVILVVGAVLVLICVLLDLMGHPVVVWRARVLP